MCSRVPKFAAYFRRTIPEVRRKSETGRPDHCFRLPRPVVMLGKIWLCSAVSDFSPHYRKTTVTASVGHGNATNTPRKQPLNAKTAFRRFPRTKPDVPSQGLITGGTVRKSPVLVNPLPTNRSELRLSNNASVKLHVSRKSHASSSFLN